MRAHKYYFWSLYHTSDATWTPFKYQATNMTTAFISIPVSKAALWSHHSDDQPLNGLMG